jgi:hypothetical protein
MFSWLKRPSRPVCLRALPRARLRLEQLETRDCPAGPMITNFSVQVESGKQVLLSGTVLDDNPAGCTVQFTGAVTGNASVTTSGGSCPHTSTDNTLIMGTGTGNFSWTATAAGLGTVTAQATDALGQTGNQAQAAITSSPPTLTLNAGAQQSGGAVTFTGQVTVGTAPGLTVTLGGAASGSGTTGANGNYSITVAASNWHAGTVTAQTTDVWGQASNTASVTVTNAAPSLSNFNAAWSANGLCTFTGLVSDEYPPGETVKLWGVPTLNGTQGYTTVTVGSNNTFTYSVTLTPQDHGTVSAQGTDWQGVTSNVVTVTI